MLSSPQLLSAGDGNCFYRALIMAVLEDLCLSGTPARCRRLVATLLNLKDSLREWTGGLTDTYYHKLRKGFYFLEVDLASLFSLQLPSSSSCFK